MGDRRVMDRRQPEKGVIKVKFKDAVIYLILTLIIIVSVSLNIVLSVKYNEYKKAYEEYDQEENDDYSYYDDEYEDDEENDADYDNDDVEE